MFHPKTVLIEKMIFQRCVKVSEAAGDGARGNADIGRPFSRLREIRVGDHLGTCRGNRNCHEQKGLDPRA
jgi:hypothetical protein